MRPADSVRGQVNDQTETLQDLDMGEHGLAGQVNVGLGEVSTPLGHPKPSIRFYLRLSSSRPQRLRG